VSDDAFHRIGKQLEEYDEWFQVCGFQDATGIATTPPSNNGLPCASYAAPQSLDGWASSKGGASAKLKDSSALTLAAAAAATQQMDRKRGRPLGSKSKRLRLDTDDALLLKSSWEEAQELLRPPPSAVPTTITIDGHEFEEYSVFVLPHRKTLEKKQSAAAAAADDCEFHVVRAFKIFRAISLSLREHYTYI
jgi:hypothetical protein